MFLFFFLIVIRLITYTVFIESKLNIQSSLVIGRLSGIGTTIIKFFPSQTLPILL